MIRWMRRASCTTQGKMASRYARAEDKEFEMSEITIYQKPTCSTCRQAVQLLKESGKPFTTINYYETPFTKTQLKNLLKKAGLSPKDILRTKEDIYKELELAKKNLSDDEWLEVMVSNPDLIQRPIVEKGEKAILARPAESVKGML
jgi:arsenate reductase (glutaredoxin)